MDKSIEVDYYRLSRENALGWNFVLEKDPSNKISLGNPIFPAVRTIASEVLLP